MATIHQKARDGEVTETASHMALDPTDHRDFIAQLVADWEDYDGDDVDAFITYWGTALWSLYQPRASGRPGLRAEHRQ